MKYYIILYIATLTVMMLLDSLWIGLIARDFYKTRIPNLEFHAVPAILFYLLYAVGVLIFVSSGETSWQKALIFGALFGFFAYATYDLTNLATLKGWSRLLAIMDIGWGTFVTSACAAAGVYITSFFKF